MELANKDLNLLPVFTAIWQERNLSRAAKKLYLSQPAVSHALNRLREQFEDPLFVRSSKGMTPTDFAISISQDIIDMVDQLDSLYRKGRQFNPQEADQSLVLATGDYFGSTILPGLVHTLAEEAPKVKLISFPDAELFSPIKFEQGQIHLGVSGFHLNPKEGFLSEKIIDDRIACVMRKKHHLLRSKDPLKDYLAADHILISVVGRSFGIVDQRLKKMRKKRNVKVVVPTFFEAGSLMKETDLVLSGPKGICEKLAEVHDLQVMDTPFPNMPFPVLMHWHQRTNNDPFHQWIRSKISEITLNLAAVQ